MRNNQKKTQIRAKKPKQSNNYSYDLKVLTIIFFALSITGLFWLIIGINKDREQNQPIVTSSSNNNSSENSDPLAESLSQNSPTHLPSTNLPSNTPSNQNIAQEPNLNLIVDKIKNLAQQRALPLDKLSISLIDLSVPEVPIYASFNDNIPRYPASIVKLFWLTIFYDQDRAGIIKSEDFKQKLLGDAKGFDVIKLKNREQLAAMSADSIMQKVLERMIKDSDNNATSVVIDLLTKTNSSKTELSQEQFNSWASNRYYLNQFFIAKGYPPEIANFNISQKTFPIYYLDIESPMGADRQIRYPNNEPESNPIRNKLTTYSMARLLYEIDTNQVQNSAQIKNLLNRKAELSPTVWQKEPYDSIEGFFGEGIYQENVQLYSKMGWTFNCRNDGAIIMGPDQKTKYILVVFGDDKKYYEDQQFFPKLSQIVYQEMMKINN